ncbi:hypothetical protein RB196_26510 [Streptomyces sp. PmtA]|uniref:hypothetical protein n=1 Tax=Streptomyces sp. PmtA TaxID=3074275 RepID=UPI003014712B
MKAEGANDFDVDNDTAITLVGIMRRAEHHIRSNSTVMAALDDINSGYLEKFSIGSDTLRGEIGVAGDATLSRALERLELRLSTGQSNEPWGWDTTTPCSWLLSSCCWATTTLRRCS